MIKKILCISSIILLICSKVFAHTADIINHGQNKYKSIRLTPEIYNFSNSDLSDLRIIDENNQTIPYFINTSYQTIYKGSYNYPMLRIDSYLKDDKFYFDYALEKEYDSDIQATSIKLASSNTNFAKQVEIFGSYDGINWTKIQDDIIYSVDNNVKLEILFNKTQKFTHYRFRLSNNLEKISFERVELNYDVSISEKSYFTETITPEFSREEQENNTHIHINGLKNLKLNEITIVSDSVFKRNASTPINSKEIYNLNFGDEKYCDTTLEMNWHIPDQDIFTLIIHNNDDKPINIDSIIVTYFADELVFDGSSSNSYTLKFGTDPSAKKPMYDIANYKEEVLKQNIDKLTLSNITFDDKTKQENEVNYELIFNITVIIVTIILGVITINKLRKTRF